MRGQYDFTGAVGYREMEAIFATTTNGAAGHGIVPDGIILGKFDVNADNAAVIGRRLCSPDRS